MASTAIFVVIAVVGGVFMGAAPAEASNLGTLTGTVRDGSSTGAPLAGVTVGVGRDSSRVATATTGSDGSYRITGLAADDDYYVVFTAATPFIGGQIYPPAIVAGGVTVADYVMLRYASLVGTVVSAGPNPVPISGAHVIAFGTASPVSDSAGTLRLNNFSPGRLTEFTVSASGYNPTVVRKTFSSGETWTTTISLTRLSIVTGTVTAEDTGLPLADVAITVPTAYYPYPVARTDAAGRYTLAGVPAGTQTVQAEDTTGNYVTKSRAAQFVGGDSRVMDFTLTAEPKGRIAGLVTEAGATPAPLRNVAALLYRAGITPPSSTVVAQAVSDSTGAYSIGRVPAGDYVVHYVYYDDDCDSESCPDNRHLDEWYDNAFIRKESTIIHVAEGQSVTGIDAALDATRSLPTVAGTVALGGSPATAAGTLVEFVTPGGTVTNSTTTLSDGTYSAAKVRTGTYAVRFTNPDYASGSTTVTVTSSVTGLNASLARLPTFTESPTPTISGSARVGQTLTAKTGSWSPVPAAFMYQWMRGGVKISGATGKTYAPVVADVGQTLSVAVTATKPELSSLTKRSASTPAVTRELTATPTPTITGAAVVGSTLTVAPGSWEPAPVTFTYKWKSNGAVVYGATSSTFTVRPADAGHTITVDVTGSKPGFVSVMRASAPTAAVLSTFATSANPTISGTVAVDLVLTAKTGTWSPSPTSFSFVWLRNGSPISGATTSSYRLTAADSGARISVTVKAAKPGYLSVSRTSAPSSVVLLRLTSTPTPTVVGSARLGSTLYAGTKAWAPAPVALLFQWMRSGVAISGATGTQYTLTAADVGKSITVSVTGTRASYLQATRTSAATPGVTSRPASD
ncbi:carboxypeptidase regulatory-like domain-containing protein [Subtercola boreus]|uniref:carboxypeptidase regulatory-like domain-containing protein n=1 Tax=Subtercola boreus TaxID=120213 RepID=UPI001473615F|nr:carboxypeptidase regulatory-like domain-containing protein [Subtercola boreus]